MILRILTVEAVLDPMLTDAVERVSKTAVNIYFLVSQIVYVINEPALVVLSDVLRRVGHARRRTAASIVRLAVYSVVLIIN